MGVYWQKWRASFSHEIFATGNAGQAEAISVCRLKLVFIAREFSRRWLSRGVRF